jgi:hypothetical protein
VTVGHVGRERALRVGLDGRQAVEHRPQAAVPQGLGTGERAVGLGRAQALDGALQVGDAVLEPVDPLLGGLFVADGVGAALLFGLELALAVAQFLLELVDAVFERRAPEQLVEHHAKGGEPQP